MPIIELLIPSITYFKRVEFTFIFKLPLPIVREKLNTIKILSASKDQSDFDSTPCGGFTYLLSFDHLALFVFFDDLGS